MRQLDVIVNNAFGSVLSVRIVLFAVENLSIEEKIFDSEKYAGVVGALAEFYFQQDILLV